MPGGFIVYLTPCRLLPALLQFIYRLLYNASAVLDNLIYTQACNCIPAPAQVACCISKLQFRSMDMPTYHIVWPASTIALPGLQDFQVSVPIHIRAEFMRISYLHLNNFDLQSCPLIDQQRLTWPGHLQLQPMHCMLLSSPFLPVN